MSLHPGVVTTEIWRNLEKMPFLSILIVLFKPLIWFTFKNCKEGAQTTLHCALDDDEVLKNNGYLVKVGDYFSIIKILKKINNSLIKKKSRESIKFAKKNFSLKAISVQYLKIFRKINAINIS